MNSGEPVPGVMINLRVMYSEYDGGELLEQSTWTYSNVNGWYDAYFDLEGSYYDWYAKGMKIMAYPGDVVLPAESFGVRWIYHYDPIQNWADPDAWWNNPDFRGTNWYVIDTDPANDWLPGQYNPPICGDWDFPPPPPPQSGEGDDNGNGVQDDMEYDIAQTFSPVLHKHYYDKQDDLANVDIILNDYSILSGEVMIDSVFIVIYSEDIPPLHVYDPSGSGYWDSFGASYYNVIWQVNFENTARHLGAAPGQRPLYFHVYSNNDGYYYLQYWYFFNMNDLRYRDQTKNDAWHEGDWEHVSLRLELLPDNDLQPVAVNFYQHYGGHTRTPEECWWSTSPNSTYTGIQQGYDENHRHLHIWLAANAHASYNRYDLVYHLEVEVAGELFEDFIDNVDYSPNGYDLYFEYDCLENMGEIAICFSCSYHNQTWGVHITPRGVSKEWLGFVGYFGDYWHNLITSTPSPFSPAINPYWRDFTYNSLTHGFGNTLGFFENLVSTISWDDDPSAGDAPNSGKPPGEF